MSETQGDAPPHRRLTAPPLPRLAALAIDVATYLIIPALLVPLGLLLIQPGVMLSSLAVNALALVLVMRTVRTRVVRGAAPDGRRPFAARTRGSLERDHHGTGGVRGSRRIRWPVRNACGERDPVGRGTAGTTASGVLNIPRCMGCSRCTWRACRAQREQPWYSSGASGPRRLIDVNSGEASAGNRERTNCPFPGARVGD